MSHNLQNVNGRYSFAFAGERSNIWHRLGQQIEPGQSIEDWAKAANLDFEAIKLPAFAIMPDGTRVNHGFLNVHNKTGHPFGHVSAIFKNTQPLEVLSWFDRYIAHDSRFKLSAAGALNGGERIWATAEFSGDLTAGGDKHKAYLLMTTAFDGSSATVNQASMIRTVCNNTLTAAMLDKSAVVKTRHSTKFDADKVAREMAAIVSSVDKYKAMGDAMARQEMQKETVAKYFKALLEIPFDAKKDDISSRKLNQFVALGDSYRDTVSEGTPAGTAWAAMNAVTRFVDHNRDTRGGSDADNARMMSANFGSGAAMKAEAVRLLTVDEEFAELMKQPFAPASRVSDGAEFAAVLAAPFRPRS